MPKRLSVLGLPTEIVDALKQRLVDSSFSGYVDLELWLGQLGYVVSKSSIHRFAQTFKASRELELRLRCASIAAHYSDDGTIVKNASDVIAWAKSEQ